MEATTDGNGNRSEFPKRRAAVFTAAFFMLSASTMEGENDLKDWNTLEADETRILSTHYTSGRSGRAIDKIVLHHNAGNLSIADCWNVWQTREASAHYQVDANGRIGQLVWDTDTAWHAGSWDANVTSIGIEHADISSSPWRISDATLDNGAHLVAALCHAYNLGRPQWGVNVFPHSHFSATACPASIQNEQRDAYMSRAQAWYDNPNEGDNDMQLSELYAAKGNDGRNLWDSVIQARNDIADLKNQIANLVWSYKNSQINGDRDAYNLLTKMPHDVAAYKNEAVSPRDVYGLITDLTKSVAALTVKVDALTAKKEA